MKKYIESIRITLLVVILIMKSFWGIAQPTDYVGYWPYSSSYNDNSSNSYVTTNNGAVPTIDRFGTSDKAYHFDGIDDDMSVENIPLGSSFTISLWFKTNTVSKNYQYFIDNSPSAIGYGFRLRYSNLSFFTYNAAGQAAVIDQTNVVSTNEWYHVAAIRTPNELKLFMNGILIHTVANSNSTAHPTTSLLIGSDHDNQIRFDGSMDELRIYNRALTDEEITAIYSYESIEESEQPGSNTSYWSKNGTNLYYSDGNVGVGTNNPSYKLTIKSNEARHIRLENESETAFVRLEDTGDLNIWSHGDDPIIFTRGTGSGTESMRISSSGRVGIGTTSPDELLTVKGTIHSEEVKVDLSVPGPDYVFESDYNLRSLEETEAYIKANKHLPEIPSAKEMEANGVQLGEMNMLLLKKIEELTLYQIEQQKIIKKLSEDSDEQKLINQLLIKRIEKLENQ